MRIACLHTAASNRRLFEEAAEGLPVLLDHCVRPELLVEAEQAGALTEMVADGTARLLQTLSLTADAVILTCSTLGPAASRAVATVPVLRADSALALQAADAALGGTLVVLCAVETTLAPTEALFRAAALRAAATVETRLVPGAWSHFRAGRTGAYLAAVAAAAEEAYADGACAVALGQVSMTPAARLCRAGRPLTAPACALRAALDGVAVAGLA
jgi:hypothetical protein